MLIVLIQEVVKTVFSTVLGYYVCLLITYFVFSENCFVCLITTKRTKQVREYKQIMYVSLGFMVYNNHLPLPHFPLIAVLLFQALSSGEEGHQLTIGKIPRKTGS